MLTKPDHLQYINEVHINNLDRRLQKTFSYCSKDPEVFLMLSRVTCENILELIFLELNSAIPKNCTITNYISDKKIIDELNEQVLNHIRNIQNNGNYASHSKGKDIDDITFDTLNSTMESLKALSKWFFKDYLKVDFNIANYQISEFKNHRNSVANLRKYPEPLFINQSRSNEEIVFFQNELKKRKSTVIIIEDDSAGIQLNVGVPFILDNKEDDIDWLLDEASKSGLGLLTTLSRASSKESAYKFHYDFIYDVACKANQRGMQISWVSRGDSCLRGHIVTEMSAMKSALVDCGTDVHLEFFIPSYVQQGRITTNHIHYARLNGKYMPLSNTEYANIPGLEFNHSDLNEYIAEKIGSNALTPAFHNVHLNDIRERNVDDIIEEICQLPKHTFVTFDSSTEEDVIVCAYIIMKVEESGIKCITRSAPSYIVNVTGERTHDQLTQDEIRGKFPRISGNGIIISGSLTSLTKKQIEHVKNQENMVTVLISSNQFWENFNSSIAEKKYAVQKVREMLSKGLNCLLISDKIISEDVVYPDNEKKEKVLKAYSEILANCLDLVSWVIIKGSDTGYTLIKWATNQDQVYYLGHIVPGANLCKTADENYPTHQIPIVLFQGNSGKENSLVEVVQKLEALKNA